jgi:hypothetical protein
MLLLFSLAGATAPALTGISQEAEFSFLGIFCGFFAEIQHFFKIEAPV